MADLLAFRLRDLPASVRLGVSGLLLTLAVGLAAAAGHLFLHHEKRDEQPGLSLDDLTGAYHGIDATAALLTALERGHPEGLAATDRQALLRWLRGDKVSENYDNLDLGEAAPAEIIDRACLSCHARASTDGDGIGRKVPLEYWDDVRSVAFSRQVNPVAIEILIASAHTHALAMGTLSLVVALLALMSRWPRRLLGVLVAACGLGLFVDLTCWFVAREAAAAVVVLAGAGAVWLASTALLLVLALLELWLPSRRAARRRAPAAAPD